MTWHDELERILKGVLLVYFRYWEGLIKSFILDRQCPDQPLAKLLSRELGVLPIYHFR
jgi:hypothetical protein